MGGRLVGHRRHRVDRVLLVVLDGLGVGALPPEHQRTDNPAHSLRNAFAAGFRADVPFLTSVGLLNSARLGAHQPLRAWGWGRTRQVSRFNESYSAHWEMAGHVATEAHGFPDGLPRAALGEVEDALRMRLIGNVGCYPNLSNVPAGVIADHHATGRPILLTQAEEEPVSVLAVYASTSVMPPDRLFGAVAAAAPRLRSMPYRGRLCGRVFDMSGSAVLVRRERYDAPFFSPPPTVLLDAIKASGRSTSATGKVGQLFGNVGFSRVYNEWGDERILANTVAAWNETSAGLVWANFNSLSRPTGAERDCIGWLRALESYDRHLFELWSQLGPADVMIVSGDHGVDPTLTGQHTHEWTPLLVGGPPYAQVSLGDRLHADIGATIAEWWDLRVSVAGDSFADVLEV